MEQKSCCLLVIISMTSCPHQPPAHVSGSLLMALASHNEWGGHLSVCAGNNYTAAPEATLQQAQSVIVLY